MMHLITYYSPTTRTSSISVGVGALALYLSNDLLNLLIGSVWLMGLWLMFSMVKEEDDTKPKEDDMSQESAEPVVAPFEGKSLNCWENYDDDITEITMDESLQMEDDWEDEEDDLALFRWEYD